MVKHEVGEVWTIVFLSVALVGLPSFTCDNAMYRGGE
jgi:hypothetical protein